MDISMHYIHIHRSLFCVHVAPKLSKNIAVQERLFPFFEKHDANIFILKLLKNKKLKNKHKFALTYDLS